MPRVREHEGWDDLTFALTRERQGVASKPDFDFARMGLLFPQNDPTEIAYLSNQMPHRWQLESELRLHVHYVQEQATSPVFKCGIRIQDNGSSEVLSYTTLTQSGNAFAYVSGSLNQIATFPAFDMTGYSLSCLVEINLYRDDNDITGDVLAKSFDAHFFHDSIGSASEYGKLT